MESTSIFHPGKIVLVKVKSSPIEIAASPFAGIGLVELVYVRFQVPDGEVEFPVAKFVPETSRLEVKPLEKFAGAFVFVAPVVALIAH